MEIKGRVMQKYFVIGKSLPHTLSPQIHKEFGLEYGVVELATQKDFDDFLANKKFCGINVTIPYKQEIMPYLDHIDDVARAVGAVNTVVNSNGKLYGFNTDVGGMEYALLQEGVTLKNKCVLILGSGGTSKTAKYVATKAGAKSIDIVSRQGELNYTNCFDKIDTQVLINTTPVGLYPHCDGLPLDIKCGFSNLESVFDVIYNPLKTMLLL
ncbi:MAG: shikimate dehydrogenase, partial [Clostridia bacterium]